MYNFPAACHTGSSHQFIAAIGLRPRRRVEVTEQSDDVASVEQAGINRQHGRHIRRAKNGNALVFNSLTRPCQFAIAALFGCQIDNYLPRTGF